MKIAVIVPRWVGDACMATPLFRGLRAHFGAAARITGVMRPALIDLFDGVYWIDDAIPYDRHARVASLGFAAAAGKLRQMRPDVTLVLPGSLSAAGLAFLGGGRRRVGYAGGGRRLLLTDRLALPHENGRRQILPPPLAYLRIGAAIGLPPQDARLELATTAADERQAERVLARLFPGRDPGGGDPLVVLNDNSASGSSRAWGVEKHAALARWLVERIAGVCVLVHCGPEDRDSAGAIVDRAADPAVAGLGGEAELPLGLSKAIYRRAALSVSSDSGPRHIGAAFGVPTVALVGPTDPRYGHSDPEGCREVRKSVGCAPCSRPVCPLGHHDCMRLITVEEVGQAALDMLGRGRRMTA